MLVLPAIELRMFDLPVANQCESSSSERPLVRGPKMPIESMTMSMLAAMKAKTPFVPNLSRKKAIMKLVNIVERRLQE